MKIAFIILVTILTLFSIIIAGLYIYFSFRNKSRQSRKFIESHKEIYGIDNSGSSLDEHETFQFFSSDQMGL